MKNPFGARRAASILVTAAMAAAGILSSVSTAAAQDHPLPTLVTPLPSLSDVPHHVFELSDLSRIGDDVEELGEDVAELLDRGAEGLTFLDPCFFVRCEGGVPVFQAPLEHG